MSPLFRATGTPDFDRLYRDHAASVYRYAFAVLGNHPDAEDVTQQTFLNAYRAIAQGTKPRKAENWLVTIAHNEVRRHFRTNGKAVEVALEDDRLAHPDFERSDPSLADILRALQKITPTQRSALVMREFEGRSYAEIAQVLEITQSALETLLFRARRALAEQLEGSLTCSEAEQAVSRRLDGRLPRREGRRLKTHLQECAHCVRFVTTQKRQRALLKGGLSVMPIPASLYLFRPEPTAAAGLGATSVAAAAGGSAAVSGGSAAGVGAIGVGAGLAAKAAAVAAVAAVTGGVGYGVATNADSALATERSAVPAAVTPPNQSDQSHVRIAQRRELRLTLAPATTKPARRRLKKAKTRSATAESRLADAAKPKKHVAVGLAKKDAPAMKGRPAKPVTPSSTKATRPQPHRAKPPKRPKPQAEKPPPAAGRPVRPKPPRVVEPPPPPPEPAAASVKKQHA